MSRSHQLMWLLLALLGLAAASFWNGASLFLGGDHTQQRPINPDGGRQGENGRGSQKNIVFILTDDQDATMDSVAYMPRLKEHIVDQGTHFANHFTTTSICCPSRVSLWTGRQPHNTNVTDVNPPYGGFPKFVTQGFNSAYLPVWLQEAGYATYYTGKMLNAHTTWNYDSPYLAGWDGNNFLLDPGTYSYLNPIYQKNHDPPVHYRNNHTTDLIQDFSKELINEAVGSKKPFFVTLAPMAPHSNIDTSNGEPPIMREPVPLERHKHLFPDAKVPRTSNFNPDRPSGVSWVAKLPQYNARDVDYLDHFHRQRLRALQGVDELVEQVVEQLDNAGVLEDTFIIYTSDNGFHLGQHRLPPGKECGFEEDIRIPFYVRGPGVARGSVEEAVTTHIDIVPTLFEMAGIEPRKDFDGKAMPVSETARRDSKDVTREHVAVEYWGLAYAEGEIGGFGGQGALVMPNNTYKAIRIKGKEDSYDWYYSIWCSNEHELYNLQDDPDQMHNRYPKTTNTDESQQDKSSIAAVIDRLDSLMMVMKSCKGNTCTQPWRVLHPDGDVDSLEDALNPRFDRFYREQVKVSYSRCEAGYIIASEGPQVGYEYREGLSWSHWT